jgi:hypothetical protein
MHDDDTKPPATGEQPADTDEYRSLSSGAIAVIFALIALACVGGYFFLMKLIDISRQEDCLLAGRRNCAQITVPSPR